MYNFQGTAYPGTSGRICYSQVSTQFVSPFAHSYRICDCCPCWLCTGLCEETAALLRCRPLPDGHADVAALCTSRQSFVRRRMLGSDGGWRHFGKYICLSGFRITWACEIERRSVSGRFRKIVAKIDRWPLCLAVRFGRLASHSRIYIKIVIGGRFTEVCQHIWLRSGKNNNFRGDLHASVTTLLAVVTFHLLDHSGFQVLLWLLWLLLPPYVPGY